MMKTPYTILTASGLLGGKNSVYHGFVVTTATATADIIIRDGTNTSGRIIDKIPATSAIGSNRSWAFGIACTDGLFIDFNGATGTVVFLHQSS